MSKTLLVAFAAIAALSVHSSVFAVTPGWEWINRELEKLEKNESKKYYKDPVPEKDRPIVSGSKDWRCASLAKTPEGQWMWMFITTYGRAPKSDPPKLTGTGGYFQPDLSKSPSKMISADMMNYLRGNVPDKFYGIKIRNGDRAYEYAKQYYAKVAPRLREEMTIIKGRVATKQMCSIRSDLYAISFNRMSWNYRNYVKIATMDWVKYPWNRWEKDGTNRKIRAYATILALYESTMNAEDEYYDVDGLDALSLIPAKTDSIRDQFPELRNIGR